MTKLRSNLPLRIAGLAAGLALAASLLASWWIQPSNGSLGADVRLLTIVPGELGATPNGVFLSVRQLKPGGAQRSGTVRLRNLTPVPMAVRFKPNSSDRALGRAGRLELVSGGRVVARGSLSKLTGSLRIPANTTRTLEARVWVPRGTPAKDFQARFTDVNLGPTVRYLRGRR
jgi:hypothetical protein